MIPRLLFVDDNRAILDGLHLALHRQSCEWDMVFTDSGVAALEHCAKQAFDVIVTDMRMPGLDGAALLSELQRRHPDAVRIVLTGHTELGAALRTVLSAHQHLVKPCARGVLIGVIQRTCRLRATLKDDAVRSLLGSVGELQMMPRTYSRVIAALSEPERPLADVAAMIEQDIALTAKVLQLVNSSFIGLGRSMSSVKAATSYLGAPMLRRAMVLLGASDVALHDVGPKAEAIESLQRHSLHVARIARDLAGSPQAAEDAFTAGMLHDIGTLFMATRMPSELAASRERARANDEPLIAAEKAIFGACHSELGAYLLGVWGLPSAITDAVAAHHALEESRHDLNDVNVLVRLADVLSHRTAPWAPPGSQGTGEVPGASFGPVAQTACPAWQELAVKLGSDVMHSLKEQHD